MSVPQPKKQYKMFDYAMAAKVLLENAAVDSNAFRDSFRKAIFEQLELCLDRVHPTSHDGALLAIYSRLWEEFCKGFGGPPWGKPQFDVCIHGKDDQRSPMSVEALCDAIKVVKKDTTHAIHILHSNTALPKMRAAPTTSLYTYPWMKDVTAVEAPTSTALLLAEAEANGPTVAVNPFGTPNAQPVVRFPPTPSQPFGPQGPGGLVSTSNAKSEVSTTSGSPAGAGITNPGSTGTSVSGSGIFSNGVGSTQGRGLFSIPNFARTRSATEELSTTRPAKKPKTTNEPEPAQLLWNSGTITKKQ